MLEQINSFWCSKNNLHDLHHTEWRQQDLLSSTPTPKFFVWNNEGRWGVARAAGDSEAMCAGKDLKQ